eukprot:785133-Prymnesium_polylepis.1
MLPGGGFSKRTAARRQRNIRIVLGLLAGVGVGFLPFYLYNLRTPGTHQTTTSAGFGVPSEWRHARHLIMVAGHAVYKAHQRDAVHVLLEDSWHLESFQHGQLATMLEHIEKGVQLAAEDNASLL